MQLPKQFKSWVQFYKNFEGLHYRSVDGTFFNKGYVAEMALKELLAAMPDDPFDIHVMAVSCENADRHKAAKFLFKLCDILA